MGWTLGDLLGDKRIEVRVECPTGKTAFDRREDARAALQRIPPNGSKMTIFMCGYCSHYHLGHRRGAVL